MKINALLFGAALVSATLVLSACSGSDPLAAGSSSDNGSADSSSIAIGSADFAESQLIASIYSQALQNAGIVVDKKFNIGSREVYMAALQDGSIDLAPEYAGSLLMYLDPEATAKTIDDEVLALKSALPDGVVVLEPSEAQDGDVLVVTKETADKYNLVNVSDLAAVGDQLVLGAAPEWKTRVNGVLGLRDLYGINFKSFFTTDVAGPLTVTALTSDQIQVADMFSTDPILDEENLVSLVDDKSLFASENVLPVISSDKLTDQVESVLNAISQKLTTHDLISMNARAQTGESIETIAKDWLAQAGLI